MQDPLKGKQKYGDIATWDVSRITSMKSLFEGMRNENGVNLDLSKWDTSEVRDMSKMFQRADLSVQGLDQVCVS